VCVGVYFCEVRGYCIAIQKWLYKWPLTLGEKSKTSPPDKLLWRHRGRVEL